MSMMPGMMGPPGPAAAARSRLADYYDNETANTLELARFANDAGLKSSFRNLLTMATRNRKFAETARRHEKLQTILGQLANPAVPGAGPMPGQIPGQAPMMGAPQSVAANPEAPNLLPEPGGPIPAYAEGGTHPGGQALVGEEGPEVVDLPAGSTVHPNPATMAGGGNPLLVVIRSLLDMLEQQDGMGLPAQDGAGMPAYAFGTPNVRGGGFRPPTRVPGQVSAPSAPGAWTPDRNGGLGSIQRQDFVGPNGQFNANQGLQALQLRNVEAGNFDPLGSQAAAGISKDAILGSMGARQAQSAKLADIYAAGDPSFRAWSRANAAANTQSEAARAYQQERANQVGDAQSFGRQVFLGGQLPATTRRDPKEPNALAQIGGQVAGAVVGAIPGVRKSGGTTSGSGPTDTPWYWGN